MNNLSRKIYILLNGEISYYRKIGVSIGENCTFNGNVNFGSEPYLISLGDNVRCSHNVSFITHDGGVHVLRNLKNKKNIDKFGNIIIGNNVFIGANSIIMPNVKIGNNVIIGAGSIVTKNIEDNMIVAGCPAKIISNINIYFEKNKNNFDEVKNLSVEEKKEFLINKYTKTKEN